MKNEVNRALVAKKATRYIFLGLLMTFALNVSARVFDAGERLYINMEAQSVKDAGGDLQYGWYSTTNNYNRAYFYKGSNGAWSSMVTQYAGTVWYVEAPAGDWEYVILTRHSSADASWDNKVTQTGNIWLYYYDNGVLKMHEQNYIQNFYYGSYREEANWEYVAPAPTGDPGTWPLAYEDEQICTLAAGSEYILQAKNYDYDNTYAHSWFKYESGVWTRLDQSEWYTVENSANKAITVTLGPAYSDVYYFLQCSRPTMCRLVRVRINQNCSEGAAGACKITSFVAVAADANVTDQTSAVNGVVAFDDKVNAGQLKIWSPNIDTVVINNKDIETPQTFKLKGFDASSQKTYTLYAKFLDDATGECEASCSVTVTPPAVSPIVHTTTGTAADPRLVRFTEEDVTLTPDNQTSTYFQWTNSANDDKINGTAQDNRNLTFDAPAEEQTIEYVFRATQDPPEPAGNLIVNGDMEYNGNFTSSYTYWGIDIHEFPTYSDPTITEEEKSGGYTLTKNSHDFYHSYSKVPPHSGVYFGLFDSKVTNNIEEQAAWVASTADNPNLKVEAGVSYLFSFWVANVNAFYQMNNGARLQFQISYNGGSTWINLGAEIDLNDYKDNRWHGMSSITTPTAPSNNVKIRVINKNTSDKNIGNDFALDDIRFEAITANTANIAALERFPVTYHKCVINNATFAQRQPNACGGTVADVDYTISFIYPRGDLYIYEGTTELAHIAHADLEGKTSYSGMIKDQPVDNAEHELTVYFLDDNNFRTDAPEVYKYQAKEVPSIALKGVEWGVTSCGVPTVTLTADIYYTNQNGELTVSVDNLPGVSATYSIEKSEQDSVTVVIPGITADGATGHVLHVSFAGSHGCTDTYVIAEAAPATPFIDTANVAFSTPGCTDLYTTLSFRLSYVYQQGKLHYSLSGLSEDSVREITTDMSEQTLDLVYEGIPADGQPHTLHIWFDGANSCDSTFQLPATPFSPVINAVTATKDQDQLMCGEDSFDVHVTITVPYVDPAGRRIELSFADSVIYVNATAATNPVDLRLHVYDAPIAFTATYPQTDCPVSSEPLASPAPSPCEIYYDTICLGEPYNEHGFDIDNTLPVGTHYFKNAIGEELYLTVADAEDMYSKWTDVLFISNPNGQYVAYQWFKNGQPMQGETLQRLYDPNGMAGTNDLYHCQMTLADGSVITTCPQTFDQTQRSAEASKNGNNQQQVIRRYRVSEHVYIIQTICGDRVETQKIFTSYE